MINYRHTNILLPVYTTNLVILKSKNKYYLYIYNSRFYFLFSIKIGNFAVQVTKNTLSVNLLAINASHLPLLKISQFHTTKAISNISKKLSELFKSWDSYYFIKIKFKGKVYKITKYKKNNLRLSFGRCHKTIMVIRSLFLKKRKKIKTKCMLFSSNKASLDVSKSLIVNTRPISMFTQRGLRLSRQLVYRKIGKKSSYTTK